MRVNYNHGGYFHIKRVKQERDSEMFLDYQILIESINDPMQYKVLRELHERT